jgi:NitT/TauT family transport system substrate-binding protein
MSPPDATIGLMSGKADFNSAFSVPPFQFQQLETPGVHTVLNSYDVMDGPHTFTCAWTSAQFHDKNKVLYQALINALAEATDIINADKRAAAQLWIDDSKSKLALDMVHKILAGEQVKWTMAPENTMKYARFMHQVGSIKQSPETWKDMFFAEVHDKSGS